MSIPIKVVSPNLPLPPAQFTPAYIDNLNKVLRLYFTNLDNINAVTIYQVSTNQTLIWLGV